MSTGKVREAGAVVGSAENSVWCPRDDAEWQPSAGEEGELASAQQLAGSVPGTGHDPAFQVAVLLQDTAAFPVTALLPPAHTSPSRGRALAGIPSPPPGVPPCLLPGFALSPVLAALAPGAGAGTGAAVAAGTSTGPPAPSAPPQRPWFPAAVYTPLQADAPGSAATAGAADQHRHGAMWLQQQYASTPVPFDAVAGFFRRTCPRVWQRGMWQLPERLALQEDAAAQAAHAAATVATALPHAHGFPGMLLPPHAHVLPCASPFHPLPLQHPASMPLTR